MEPLWLSVHMYSIILCCQITINVRCFQGYKALKIKFWLSYMDTNPNDRQYGKLLRVLQNPFSISKWSSLPFLCQRGMRQFRHCSLHTGRQDSTDSQRHPPLMEARLLSFTPWLWGLYCIRACSYQVCPAPCFDGSGN